MAVDKPSRPVEKTGFPQETSLFQTKEDKLNIILVPKLTNPFICRFFNPRYAFDTGILALGSYVRDKADVSIKSIFGHLGKRFLTMADMEKISKKSYLHAFAAYIVKTRPDIVGISCVDTSLLNTVVLSKAIKRQNKHIRIVLGGPGVFYNYSDLMTHFDCIDYCILGEGEKAFDQLIDCFNGKTKIDQVPGLAYRDGTQILTGNPAEFVDINALPYLDLSLYDISADCLTSMACETGRGCPFKCTFCSTTAFWGNCFRVKDPDRIADEIAFYCQCHKKISHFDFHSHDNFLTHKTHLQNLSAELEKRHLKISWNCSSRIDHLDDDFIELLKKSGCNYIDCGPESGSTRIRTLINKNIDYKATLANIEKLTQQDIGVAVNFMFGFPTETIDELEQTFEHACRCVDLKADIVFCFLSPLKETKIYTQFEHLLVNKTQDHLHDFTDNRANYLFGTRQLCKTHPCFKTRAKMFFNGQKYDTVVNKIRSIDSVHIFTHLNHLLLALKHGFSIDIVESKTALKSFPYSEDLFRFAQKKAKSRSISSHTMADVFYKAIQAQRKNPSAIHFKDITVFILLDQMICQQDIFLPQWNDFRQTVTNDFFKAFSGNKLYQSIVSMDDFQLQSAFKIPQTLFMKFRDLSSPAREDFLTGILVDRNDKKTLVCYTKQANDKEKSLLNRLEKMIPGEIHA